jgi:hypothetical protein
VLTTCQPSTDWCSRERLPAAAAQPAKVRQSCSATDYYYIHLLIGVTVVLYTKDCDQMRLYEVPSFPLHTEYVAICTSALNNYFMLY